MEVHETIAQAFHAEGVRAIFNIMGDGNKLFLVSAAAQPGMHLYNTRHEGAALAMADGYARASGDVGVCSVTYATGVAQIATSLGVAAKHRTPLVVLAADTPAEQRGMGGHLDMDARALVRAVGALACELRTPASAAEDVHLAFYRARSERRPVVLLARTDIQEAATPSNARPAGPIELSCPPVQPDPDGLARAIEVIRASKRPVVIAGRGAVEARARDSVQELAEAAGALVATTLQAKGWLDDDPYNLGIAGTFSNRHARRLLGQADCVIGLGASLNAYTTADGSLFPAARMIQIDAQTSPLVEGLRPADVRVHGDAAIAARMIADAVSKGAGERGWRNAEVRQILARDPRQMEIEENPAELPSRTMDPRKLMLAIDEVIPRDCSVVVGVGHYTSFPTMYLRNPGTRDFHTILDFITIGQAIPEAMGVAVARPSRPVVAIEGDASFMMHVQEIETAVRYSLPVLIFVVNDGALGAEYHKLRVLGLDPSEAILPTADLSEIGAAFGARTRSATSVEEIKDVGTWFDSSQGPHIVECHVARTVVGPL